MPTSADWTNARTQLDDTTVATNLVGMVQQIYNNMLQLNEALDRYAVIVGGLHSYPELAAAIDALYPGDRLTEIQECAADASALASWHLDHPDLLAV
jgi:hypothetical protein